MSSNHLRAGTHDRPDHAHGRHGAGRHDHSGALRGKRVPGSRLEPVLRRLREVASRDFGIHHVTIQVEQSPDDCNEHHHADRLHPRERASEA